MTDRAESVKVPVPRSEPRITGRPTDESLMQDLAQGSHLAFEELLTRYTRVVHTQSDGNIEETARRLNVDRRTVKARIISAR